PELLVPRPEEEADTSVHLSCTDLVLSMQQSRTINNHMASLVYGYVEQLLYGGLMTFATYTDNAVFTTRSLSTTPEDLSQALGREPSFFTAKSEEQDDKKPDLEDEDDVMPL